MALGCINILSPDFLDLKKQTGLNEHILAAKIKSWQDRNKRELDEFPTADDLGYIARYNFSSDIDTNTINYNLKVVDALLKISENRKTIRLNTKDKPYIEENLTKALATSVPKAQIKMVFDKLREKGVTSMPVDQLITDLLAENSFAIEISTAVEYTKRDKASGVETFISNGYVYSGVQGIYNRYKLKDSSLEDSSESNVDFDTEETISETDFETAKKTAVGFKTPSRHFDYVNITGGENYRENAIRTPGILNISSGLGSHITDFSEGIPDMLGWFRSDDRAMISKAKLASELTKDLKDNLVVQITNGKITVLDSWEDADESEHLDQIMEYPNVFDSSELYNGKFVVDKSVIEEAVGSGYTLDSVEVSEDAYTRRILELQSYLFQENRDKSKLTKQEYKKGDKVFVNGEAYIFGKKAIPSTGLEPKIYLHHVNNTTQQKYDLIVDPSSVTSTSNQFLQLLNTDNNWVTFFVKSILQDSARRGYEKVLFPTGRTAAKIEQHVPLKDQLTTLEEQIQKLSDFDKAKLQEELKQTQIEVKEKEDEIAELEEKMQALVDKAEFGFQEIYVNVEGYDNARIQHTDSPARKGNDTYLALLPENYKGYYIYAYNVGRDRDNNAFPPIVPSKVAIPITDEKALEYYEAETHTILKLNVHDRQEYLNLKNKVDFLSQEGKIIQLKDNIKNFEVIKRSNEKRIEEYRNEKADLLKTGPPIESFYENRVTNTLNKIFGKSNVKKITDEHSNTWNEVNVGEEQLADVAFSRKPVTSAFRISKTKSGQKEYDLDKKPKGESTEVELVIDPSRTLDITEAQESGIATNDMLIYEQILREAKYEYDYVTSDTYKQMSPLSRDEDIGAIVAKKALEKGYEGVIQYKSPYAPNVQAIRDKGRKYTKFGSLNPNQIDLDDAKQWLESRGLSFDMAQQTIEIAKGMPHGVEGLFSEGVIYLSKYATKGTEYHEAFHAVFRMFLTDEQQDAILAESKKQRPVSQEELDELEEAGYFRIGDDGKIYKNIDVKAQGKGKPTIITGEELERLVLEERLAEQFRSYVISNQKVKSLSEKIQKFFSDLWKYIKYYFSNKMTIDRLFFNIDKGRINKKNLNMRFASKGAAASFSRNESKLYNKFSDSQIENIINDINSYFISLNKQFPEDSPNDLYSAIRRQIKKGIFVKNNNLLTSKEASFHIENLKMLLDDDLNITKEFQDYMTNNNLVFRQHNGIKIGKTLLFTDLLWEDASAEYGNIEDRGILYKAKIGLQRFGYKVYGDEVSIHEDQDDIDEKIYDKSHLEENRKDTLSKDIKEFLTFIPVLVKDSNDQFVKKVGILGADVYYNFDELYSNIAFSLTNSKSYDHMIKNLELRSNNFPELKSVLNELKSKQKNEMFKSKFYSAMANTYNNFIGAIEEVMLDANGTKAGIRVRYYNSNLNNVEKKLLKRWKNNSRASDGTGLLTNSDENELVINEDILDRLNDTSEDSIGNVLMNYYNRRKRSLNSIPLDEEIDAIAEFANLLGMDIPRETFELAFNNGIIIKNQPIKGYDLFGYLTGGASTVDDALKLKLYEKANDNTPVATLVKEDANGYIMDPYTEYVSVIKKFALLSASFERNAHGSFINAANKSTYPINTNTTLDRIINAAKTYDSKSTEFWDEWLRQFKEDPFYMPSRGSSNRDKRKYDSILISEILNSTSTFINDMLEISDFDAYKKRNEFVTKNTFELLSDKLSLIHRLNAFGNNGNANEMLIVLPTLADRTRMMMLSLPRLSHYFTNNDGYTFTNTNKLQDKDGNYSIFMRYVVQDILDAQNGEKMTTRIKNYDKNHKLFRQLPYLNETEAGKKLMEYALANPDAQLTNPSEEVSKLLDQVQLEINKYVENEIQQKTRTYKTTVGKNISDEVLNIYEKKGRGQSDLSKNEKKSMFIKDYIVNTMIFEAEIIKLTSGDPGLYKNSLKGDEQINTLENESKRYGSLATPGTEFRIQDAPDSYGSKPKYTIGVINDIFRKNETLLESLDKIITDKRVLDVYKEGNKKQGSNVADGMGITTLEYYRSISRGNGTWGDKNGVKEQAYQNYKKNGGRFVDNKGRQVKLKPLKTYSDGLYLKDFGNGVKKVVRIMVKHSTFPLLAEFTKGTGFDNIRMRMEKSGPFEKIENISPIDEINMDSAIKSGLHNAIDLELDNDGNPSIESLSKMQGIELDTHFLRMPQIIPDTAKESRIGSQFMKLLITNLKKNFDNPYVVGNTVLTGKQLYDIYGELIEQQLEMGVDKVFSDFGIPKNEKGQYDLDGVFNSADKTLAMLKNIRKVLNNSIEERELPDTYLKALNIVKVEESNEKDYDFASPLAMPVFAEKFANIILAICKRGFMRININGQGLVQIAEIGKVKTDEEGTHGLKFIQGKEETVSASAVENVVKDVDEETGKETFYEKIVQYNDEYWTVKEKRGDKVKIQKIISAEIAMPWEFAQRLNLPKNKNGEYDISSIPKDVLTLIGYRIPTQGKNSMLPLKIVKILPKSMSKMIMVPAEITTQMGSDFDIDKLFTMIPNLKVKGTLKNGQKFDWFETYKSELLKNLPKNIKLSDKQISLLLEDTEYYLEIEGLDADEETAVHGAAIQAKKKTVKALNNLKNWTISKVKYDINNLKKATKKGLENAYIDIAHAMLTSPYHIDDVLKTIDSPLLPGLANFFKRTIADYNAILDRNNVDSQRALEERNKAGSKGISISAVATTGQAGRQFTKLKTGIPYLIDNKKYSDLTLTEDKEGNDISYQLQQHLTIAVDNANDPIMLFLMDNAFTSGVRNAIISLGISHESMKGDSLKKMSKEKGIDVEGLDDLFKSANGDAVVWASFFLNQPIIRKLYKEYINKEGTPGKLYRIANSILSSKMKAEIINATGDTELDSLVNYVQLDIPLKSEKLIENFNKSLDDKSDVFAKDQLQVLGLFLQLFTTGNDISKVNRILNSDRIKDFNNPAGIEAHLDLIDYFEKKKIITERVRAVEKANVNIYKGGFEDKGKGTPQGDGKDKAMRKIADGFIGEVSDKSKKSSTLTSHTKINSEKNRLEYPDSPTVSYEPFNIAPKVIMLARNGALKGKDLSSSTLGMIKLSHENGAKFVVGDMPGVDSQFIDYLKEIGANFTIYHTGKTPRIKVSVTQPQVKMETDVEYIPTRGIDDISSILEGDYPIANSYIKMIGTAKALVSKFFPYYESGLEDAKANIANELATESLTIDQIKAINKDAFMHLISQKQEGYAPSPFAPLFSTQWENKLLTGDNNIAVQFRKLRSEIADADPTDSIKTLMNPDTAESKFFSKLDENEDNTAKEKTTSITMDGLRTMLRKRFSITKNEKDMIRNKRKPKSLLLRTKRSNEFSRIGSEKNIKIGNEMYTIKYKGAHTLDTIKTSKDVLIKKLALKKADKRRQKDYKNNYLVKNSKGEKFIIQRKTFKNFLEGTGKQIHLYDIFRTPPKQQRKIEEKKETDRYRHKTLSFNQDFAYSKEEKDTMTQGFMNMLTHENEKVREFAKNLVYYHILSRGFDNGVNAFIDMIPNEVWDDPGMSLLYKKDEEGNLVQELISLNEYIRKHQLNYFKDPKFFKTFIEDFIAHRSATPYLIRQVKLKSGEIKKLNNNKSVSLPPDSKLGLYPKFYKTLHQGKFMLLVRTAPGKYVKFNSYDPANTSGEINDMWRFQRFNIERLKDKKDLTTNSDRQQDQNENFICAF